MLDFNLWYCYLYLSKGSENLLISGFYSSSRLSKASEMDHHWVATSWLSDVGLPQYSQTFQTHLVDGRVLNSLSRRDLERFLNISDQYHQTSLLLAIQLLQMLSFDKEVRLWIKIEISLFSSLFSIAPLLDYRFHYYPL